VGGGRLDRDDGGYHAIWKAVNKYFTAYALRRRRAERRKGA